jgi:hypothetical protein
MTPSSREPKFSESAKPIQAPLFKRWLGLPSGARFAEIARTKAMARFAEIARTKAMARFAEPGKGS